MNNTVIRCIFAIVLLGLPVRTASAADAQTCRDFAAFASKNAQEVRALGGCGLNLADESLSTSSSAQMRWCLGVQDTQTITTRVSELVDQTILCKFCQSYARTVTEAALDNIRLGCGYTSNPNIDDRWKPDYNYHFKGCMAVPGKARWLERSEYIAGELTPIAGSMALQISECKNKRGNQNPPVCKTCHETQKPTALLPAALRPPPKRGSSGHDFSVVRQTPSFKPEGSSSGENDQANPSGERRRNPRGNRGTSSGESDQVQRGAPNPCGSELKPCKPSRIMSPGLLDGGGGGGGSQGPAATGTPMQSGAPTFQRGGGGGSGLR
jgi:hypothetical protein